MIDFDVISCSLKLWLNLAIVILTKNKIITFSWKFMLKMNEFGMEYFQCSEKPKWETPSFDTFSNKSQQLNTNIYTLF